MYKFFVYRYERMYSVCEGKYIIYFVGFICVGYNISFYFNKILIIKLKDFLCYIEMCLIDERFWLYVNGNKYWFWFK